MQNYLLKIACLLLCCFAGAGRGIAQTADYPTLYGGVIFAYGWGDMQQPPYGVYSIPANDGTAPQAVHISPELKANGGGVYIDGIYYIVSYETYSDAIDVSLRAYDTRDNWKLISETPLENTTSIAADLTYDPVTDQVFGCFGLGNDETGRSYYLGTLNVFTGEVTPIGNLSQKLFTLSCNKEGELYGIGEYAELMRVDKETAALTLIGTTGKNIKYDQSAAFDYATGRLFWVMTPHGTEKDVEVCEVNLTTGAAEKLTTVDKHMEFVGLYTTSPFTPAGAPGRIGSVAADFPQGATSGTVRFTLPSQTFGGDALSGTLAYRVRIDGNVIAEGTAAAGSSVGVPATMAEGAHIIKIDASNAAGRCPVYVLREWIGRDTPKAVNPTATLGADNLVTVAWGAAQGTHGGYVDGAAVTYKVVRQPDGATIYEGNATSCTEAAEIARFGVYTYDVESYWGNVKGETATTEEIVLGKEVPLPYKETFNTPSSLMSFTIEDTNGDNNTWFYEAGSVTYAYAEASMLDGDDWLISPPFLLDTEHVYELSFKAASGDGYADIISAWLGTRPQSGAMTQNVLPETEVNKASATTLTAMFHPEADGRACIGLHATSTYETGYFLTIDDLQLRELASVHAPAAATDVQVTAAAAGALGATITCTLPLTDISGAPLDALTQVVVKRGTQTIATLTDVTPGRTITVNDTPTSNGNFSYTVVASNAYGAGLVAKATAYVGEDTPGNVENIKVNCDASGNISLSWDAPSVGTHGGYVNASTLSYTVTDMQGQKTETSQRSFSTTVTPTAGKQTLAWFGIQARGLKGNGPVTPADTVFVGDAYALPYAESFSKRGIDCGPWVIQESDVFEWKYLAMGSYSDAQDGDGGLMAYINGAEGTTGALISPKISLAGADNPTLRFHFFRHHAAMNELAVIIRDGAGNRHEVLRLKENELSGADVEKEWTRHYVSLAPYAAAGPIQVQFQALGHLSPELMNVLYVDNISVFDWHERDLSAGTLVAEKSEVKVGETNTFTLSYRNNGSLPATDYSVELLRDGKVVFTAEGAEVAPDAPASITLTDTPNSDAAESSVYSARIVAGQDFSDTDNLSNAVTVTVLPGLPFVSNVTANYADGVCTLSWEKPFFNESSEATDVVEDFESYTAFTIQNLGQWTLYDGDGRLTAGIQNGYGDYIDYPNAGAAMAYQVFNPSKAGLTSFTWQPHSGQQVLAAFTSGRLGVNNDWLISPPVNGGQTVTFWAKSPSNNTYGTVESIEVLYSEGSTDAADFTKIGSTITVPGSWRQISFDLPESAQRFAIRCVSDDQYILYIDDIAYRRAADGLTFVGYNVYRDGEKLTAAPIAEPAYSETMPAGEHNYAVSVVYTTGESILSPATFVSPTGIGTILMPERSSQPAPVYDLSGRRVNRAGKGIYIVGGKKVFVK